MEEDVSISQKNATVRRNVIPVIEKVPVVEKHVWGEAGARTQPPLSEETVKRRKIVEHAIDPYAQELY